MKLFPCTLLSAAMTAILSAGAVIGASAFAQEPPRHAAAQEHPRGPVALGRYLVRIAGCNDCHTAGYGQSGGKVPESQWLMGDSLGWNGPWGTTYASNLRIYFAAISETQWLHLARTKEWRPPMPWFNLRTMSDKDLRAIYRYVRAAGAAGQPAPAYVPPGTLPAGPVVRFP